MPIPTSHRVGYGLMNLTWKPQQTPDEQAFEAIKTAVDGGCTMLNSGEFYGQPDPELGLKLLGRFYAQYPEYAVKTYLSVKGGMAKMQPDASEEALRTSVTNINKLLGGNKKMDLFEMARVDKKVSIEDTMKTLLKLRDEGHFKDIGLSECSADTIRRAAKVGPVAAVEVEYSPFSLDIEHNGVLEACTELGIPIAAYSPLARGMMNPKIKSNDDIPEGDHLKHSPRFQPGNIEKNLELAEKLREVAAKKNVSGVQVVLAWEIAQNSLIYPIPGSTRPEGVKECIEAVNVKLSKEEVDEITKLVKAADVAGDRYPKQLMAMNFG